jgi:hypothetical protein
MVEKGELDGGRAKQRAGLWSSLRELFDADQLGRWRPWAAIYDTFPSGVETALYAVGLLVAERPLELASAKSIADGVQFIGHAGKPRKHVHSRPHRRRCYWDDAFDRVRDAAFHGRGGAVESGDSHCGVPFG